MDEVTLGEVSLWILSFPLVTIIPPTFHGHSFVCLSVCHPSLHKLSQCQRTLTQEPALSKASNLSALWQTRLCVDSLFVASSLSTMTQGWPSPVSEMVGALSYRLNECAHSEVNMAVSCSPIGCHTMQTPTLQHDWSTHNHCPLEQIREMDCPYKQIDSSEL
jgi:hypothetical protein